MYCPNPNCPERELAGTANEYAEHITGCPICGTQLVHDPPSFPPTPKRRHVPEPTGKDLPYWREYRRRRAWYWAAFAAFLPYAFVFLTIYDARTNRDSVGAFLFAFVLYFAVAVVPAVKFLRWRCPRCKKSFHSRLFFSWPYGGACLHCHLPLWQRVGK